MPSSHRTTPSESFHHRDIDFDMEAAIPMHWLGGSCHVTRFYDAMSIMFPEGERSFIESVQLFRHRLGDDAALKQAVREFVAQEALHSREHRHYNRRLQAQGAPVATLERRVKRQQDFARKHLPECARLAITLCLEHFTAVFADRLLRDDRHLADAHPLMAQLWLWHALEETEHKAVAFDVFTAAIRGPLRRYALRCGAMLLVTPIFWTLLWRTTFDLVRHDGQAANARGWLGLIRAQLVRPGLLRYMVPHWFAWFMPRFHPWRHDNRALVARFAPRFDLKSRRSSCS